MSQSADPERPSPSSGAIGVRLALAFAGLWLASRSLGGVTTPASDAQGADDRAPDARRERHDDTPDVPGTAGRGAETPDEIPPKGWQEILWRLKDEIENDRVLAVAAGVTFYVLLAVFPAITALVSIYGLFADPSTIQQHLASVASFIPGGALDIVGAQIERITSQGDGKLGFALAFGILTSIWSANAGMKALFDALNVAYGDSETRNFFKLNAVSLAFTGGMLVLAVLALAAAVAVPILLKQVNLGAAFETAITWLRWPVLFLILVGALAVLYRFGPTRKKPRWQWITIGSTLAGAAWVAASAGFSYYASNFGSYNETYGTLGAAIGFMTWVWISVIVVMVGAELNSEIETQATGKQDP